jgi:hypothetical protein
MTSGIVFDFARRPTPLFKVDASDIALLWSNILHQLCLKSDVHIHNTIWLSLDHLERSYEIQTISIWTMKTCICNSTFDIFCSPFANNLEFN